MRGTMPIVTTEVRTHKDRGRFARVRTWARRGSRNGRLALTNLFFPPRCLNCECELPEAADHPLLCQKCLLAASSRKTSCVRCASPLPTVPWAGDSCPRCRGRDYSFDAALAVGVYEDTMKQLVLRMKRAHHEPYALSLGTLVATKVLAADLGEPPLIAPVPMHWARRFRRGGNHVERLAERVAKRTRWKPAFDLLACRRRIKKQGTLTPAARFRNVRGAFRVSSSYAIKGAHVLIIDDVLTTGATASEMARLLKKAGAKKVTIAVVARGIGIQ